jgi:serine/threonine protein kinase
VRDYGPRTTDLALALLEVLEYLHERRPPVFHRDIKPSNIVLRPSGAALVDFGGVGQGGPAVQGGSTVSGTFGYMAPEQLLGQVSPASDLYFLGATLLHVLTGREPTEFSFEAGASACRRRSTSARPCAGPSTPCWPRRPAIGPRRRERRGGCCCWARGNRGPWRRRANRARRPGWPGARPGRG